MRYCVCGATFGTDHDHDGRIGEQRLAWMTQILDREIELRAEGSS